MATIEVETMNPAILRKGMTPKRVPIFQFLTKKPSNSKDLLQFASFCIDLIPGLPQGCSRRLSHEHAHLFQSG